MSNHNHPQSKEVINRLSRAIGHLESVKRMAEEGRSCTDILTQTAAVISALNNVSKLVIEDHVNHCVVEASKEGETYSVIIHVDDGDGIFEYPGDDLPSTFKDATLNYVRITIATPSSGLETPKQ